jgi:hypothetical protein
MVEPVLNLRHPEALCIRRGCFAMKCDLCNLDNRLVSAQLCAVCSEAIARAAWAQLRIEVEKAAELSKATALPAGMDADEYRKAFGG